jgi:nicotinamide-nucleotide amidase
MVEDTLTSLSKICLLHKAKIATAESCTGGLVAMLITNQAGSSQWFDRGFVTYTNLAKQQMLDVAAPLLVTHGAVSEPVAQAMAEGALKHSQAHYALAITGIAGPGGGSGIKPVGMVCFAWAYYKKQVNSIEVHSSSQYFSGDRQSVREQSALFSLTGLLDRLKINS